MIPIVLVHGGGFDRRCWEPLLAHLDGPTLAVDLPGRGTHPMPLGEVTFERCAETVAADVDAAGFDEVVLVGHSLAGCSMPAITAGLGGRVRHLVFVACTVPDDGTATVDTLDPELQALVRAMPRDSAPGVMDEATARLVIGSDLDAAQFAWCYERSVPEAMNLTVDPVDLAPVAGVPATWVRTLHDLIVPPDKQVHFAANVGPGCEVVDLDAGHMCMVGRPRELAAILNRVAGAAPRSTDRAADRARPPG